MTEDEAFEHWKALVAPAEQDAKREAIRVLEVEVEEGRRELSAINCAQRRIIERVIAGVPRPPEPEHRQYQVVLRAGNSGSGTFRAGDSDPGLRMTSGELATKILRRSVPTVQPEVVRERGRDMHLAMFMAGALGSALLVAFGLVLLSMAIAAALWVAP